jgi:hypothetical protein
MKYASYAVVSALATLMACQDGPTSPDPATLGSAHLQGSSLRVTEHTASGFWQQRIEYDWTGRRFVYEIHIGSDMHLHPDPTTVEILPGQMAWVTVWVEANRRVASDRDVIGVAGRTCFTNDGSLATRRLTIVEEVQAQTTSGWMRVPGATLVTEPTEQLDAGGSRCFPYEIAFEAKAGVQYRVIATVFDAGRSQSSSSAEASFSRPAERNPTAVEIDAEAFARDAMTESCNRTLGPDFTCLSADGLPLDFAFNIERYPDGRFVRSYMVDIKNEGVCGKTSVLKIDEPLRESGGELREMHLELKITTGDCEEIVKCPKPEAYWRERTGSGSLPDEVSQYLSIVLGRPDGPNTLWITIPFYADRVFQRHDNPSIGINELYAQLLTAKLNIAAGVNPMPIREVRIAADLFLSTHWVESWPSMTEQERSFVLELAEKLKAFNEGHLTPTCGSTPPDHGGGCTRTIGYWKNHPERITPLIQDGSVWLGTASGSKSIHVTTSSQAVDIVDKSGDASNGINKLYAQLLGAKLNIESGAAGAPITNAIHDADAFLATHSAADWDNLTQSERQQVLAWKDALDDYNNGRAGVPHCD